MSDTDIIIKPENDNDCNGSLLDLATLLQEVKKEEQIALSDEETQEEKNKDETLPESFFDDLYRDEIVAASDEATTDADIQKLQEIIAKKKRILHEDGEPPEDGRRHKSRSHSPESNKRKNHPTSSDENQHKDSRAKRPRNTIDTPEEDLPNQNELVTLATPPDDNICNQQPPTPANDCSPQTEQATDSELELENLLKTEDYNSDEEPPNTSQAVSINNNTQTMYGFPNAMPMVPTMYNPGTNQMMANMPTGGYPMMCNMGFQQGFYQPNMMNMQMMGFGVPQMNVPPTNDSEVQCLPVVNSGLPKIPFRKIKLEKVSKTVEPAEDSKRKIIEACIRLLQKLDCNETTGKFVYTATITKHSDTAASNSVLQKITNVSYNFQSIGPKQNLQDWGLKGIPIANSEIAKKISMSADKYFNKITENANSTARKLIKQEADKADKIKLQEQMEVEELTLSTYFKNSMTQTDAMVCRECVARKRKVGHDIAVQACAFTGSIGTQTSSEVRFNDQLTEGLSENQLKALYEFSMLIRESPKNTSAELLRLREHLMNMYNLSQRQHKGLVPFMDASSSHLATVQSPVRDPRIDNRSIQSDPRRFSHLGTPNQIVHQPPVQATPQQNPNYSQHRMQMANQQIPNYTQIAMQIPNQQIPAAQFPGRIRPSRPQERAMQIPNQQRHQGHPGSAAQYPHNSLPEFPQQFPHQEGRKNFGRGGLRR